MEHDITACEQELALLKNKLQVPLVARDYLAAGRIPDGAARYALHEMMGNLQPQDALLCAAFILKEIAAFNRAASADMNLLHLECDRIIACYATRDNFGETNVTLRAFAEDMESFAELIDLCHVSYDVLNPKAVVLLDIMATQIHAHITIVDTVLGMMEQTPAHRYAKPVAAPYADNVIPFPAI